jgi:PIN domain nuclease of toxin-antitoxin system
LSLLVDTHIIVWLADDPARLNEAERTLLFDQSRDIAVSAVSIWEIRIKSGLRFTSGTPKLGLHPDAALRLVDFMGFRLLALSPDDAATRLSHSISHHDPFDEMLLIEAQRHNLKLLTRDALLQDHPLALFA